MVIGRKIRTYEEIYGEETGKRLREIRRQKWLQDNPMKKKEIKEKISQSLRGNQNALGSVRSEETKEKIRMAFWKGGTRQWYQKQARKIMEEQLGRKLVTGEIVHHIDGNWENNYIGNLYLFEKRGYHLNYHRRLKKWDAGNQV